MAQAQDELYRALTAVEPSLPPLEPIPGPHRSQPLLWLPGGKMKPLEVRRLCRSFWPHSGWFPVVTDRDQVFELDLSPAEIFQQAPSFDVDASLEGSADRTLTYRTLTQSLDDELELLQEEYDTTPDRTALLDEIEQGRIRTIGSLQRRLLKWEAQRYGKEPTGSLPDRYLKWTGWGTGVMLLPVEHPWQAFGYFDLFDVPPVLTAALARQWQEMFGAELVGGFGTILEFDVARPPSRLAQTLDLAWQQQTVAECTTIPAGIPLFHHAKVLVNRRHWFLHQRP